jgi:hypothetical protein
VEIVGEVEKNLGEVQQSSSRPPWKVRAYKKIWFKLSDISLIETYEQV